jgi:TonB family protein
VITWPRWTTFVVVVLSLTTVLTNSHISFAQDEAVAASNRKIVNKVVPQYPAWARSMNLSGIVKVEATVSSNGVVKTVEVKGGHPVLIQSATDAVRKWKWEPASHESKEFVEVRFDPQ